ncbi:HupE/UreJ family protein [Leeia sp. TBRC 13508]|uniref:HupE/UreJ family protein n=1 Tax=Leeia speluncae TaxID=2884804 RepID=A0ABS8D321_9NEIS|nr:HupE/UreJ family protein [Leeia speluncae]MCB6182396.1 HupE/UreJ family protein [Leeia speluncae]
MKLWKYLPAVAMGAMATVASAHPGHAETVSFLTGALHPLTGLDHLLVMFGVGVWAAQQEKSASLAIPVTFVLVMMLSGIAGYLGVTLPRVETGIASSVVLIGLLVAFAIRLPAWIGMLMTTVFAVFHGHAHGSEYSESHGFWLYGLGFALVTAALHASGYLVGYRFSQNRRAVAVGGVLMATAGVVMLSQTI